MNYLKLTSEKKLYIDNFVNNAYYKLPHNNTPSKIVFKKNDNLVYKIIDNLKNMWC